MRFDGHSGLASPARRKSSGSTRTDSAASDPSAAWLNPTDTPDTRLRGRRTPPQDGTSHTGTRNSSRLRSCTWHRTTKDEKDVERGPVFFAQKLCTLDFRPHIISLAFFDLRGMVIGPFVLTAVSTKTHKHDMAAVLPCRAGYVYPVPPMKAGATGGHSQRTRDRRSFHAFR